MRVLTLAFLSLLPLASVEARTRFSYVSDPNEYIGQGGSATWTDAQGTWQVRRNFDQGISFSFYSDNLSTLWFLDFSAPFDADLTTGNYPNAQRWPFQIQERPGLSVTGEGRGCNSLTGDFTVTSVNYGSSAEVLKFSAAFVQYCEGGNPALRGTIDFVDESVFIFTDAFEGNASTSPDRR